MDDPAARGFIEGVSDGHAFEAFDCPNE